MKAFGCHANPLRTSFQSIQDSAIRKKEGLWCVCVNSPYVPVSNADNERDDLCFGEDLPVMFI